VSVIGEAKKGKSKLIKDSRRPLRQGLRTLVASEIPHQQNNEEYDDKHEDAE
jgi:hypothetical protein